MKCKDCIHYAAHKHFYFGEDEKDFDEYFNDDNVESQCPEFEDKKEWLKLPCKVGDKAYWIARNDIQEDTVEGFVATEEFRVLLSDFAPILGHPNLFFSREAAEKALAERSEK